MCGMRAAVGVGGSGGWHGNVAVATPPIGRGPSDRPGVDGADVFGAHSASDSGTQRPHWPDDTIADRSHLGDTTTDVSSTIVRSYGVAVAGSGPVRPSHDTRKSQDLWTRRLGVRRWLFRVIGLSGLQQLLGPETPCFWRGD